MQNRGRVTTEIDSRVVLSHIVRCETLHNEREALFDCRYTHYMGISATNATCLNLSSVGVPNGPIMLSSRPPEERELVVIRVIREESGQGQSLQVRFISHQLASSLPRGTGAAVMMEGNRFE